MLPLSDPFSKIYHYIFAIAGFAFEFIFVLLVLVDILMTVKSIPRWAATVTYICSFMVVFACAMFIVGLFDANAGPNYTMLNEIIAEYLVGVSSLVLVKTLEYSELYSIVDSEPWCCL
jgi:hypothetical protein